MKFPVALALMFALSLSACGGGGSTGPIDDGPGEPGDQEARAAMAQILDECGKAGIAEMTSLLRIMEPLLAPDTLPAAPGFAITGFSIANATLDWALDVEDDGSVEVTGSMGFRTAADAPFVPPAFITIIPGLGGDISNIADLLATLPDGTILRTTFAATQTFTSTGTSSLSFSNPSGSSAVPSSTSGSVTVDQGDCDTQVSWADVPFGSLLGQYPNATMNMVVTTQADAVNGTIVFDGTPDATVNSTLQSTGTQQQYTLNLETGVLTPVN